MNVAKELNDMGLQAGGDGRAILTIEATSMPYTTEEFKAGMTTPQPRATKVMLYVSLSRGRSIAVERTRRLGEPVIAEVLQEGRDAVNTERDECRSFLEALNQEAEKLKYETERIIDGSAVSHRLEETITCGELDILMLNVKNAIAQLKRIRVEKDSPAGSQVGIQ